MQKYIKVFELAILHSLKNYKALIGLSIFLITCLVIFAHLWQIIAATKTGIVSFLPDQLLWYIALNEWVLVSLPDVQDEMEQDLRSGRLAYLLPRPISYLGSVFCEGFGMLCANLLVLGMVTFSFTWGCIGSMPFPVYALPIMIAIGLLAGCVGLIFQMLVGISAFWLQQVGPFHWIWEKLLFTLGGLMLPLTVYPLWLQNVASLTPFPALLSQRSALAIDFSLHNVLQVTASLLVWGFFGMSLLIFLYRKGLRIVNIEGG